MPHYRGFRITQRRGCVIIHDAPTPDNQIGPALSDLRLDNVAQARRLIDYWFSRVEGAAVRPLPPRSNVPAAVAAATDR